MWHLLLACQDVRSDHVDTADSNTEELAPDAGNDCAPTAEVCDGVDNDCDSERPHVGACDADVEGTWTWVSGEPVGFDNWHGDEPNNLGTGEDCLELTYSGAWNDIWCSENPYTTGYVCEFDP